MRRSLLTVLVVLGLAACGGGGGSSTGDPAMMDPASGPDSSSQQPTQPDTGPTGGGNSGPSGPGSSPQPPSSPSTAPSGGGSPGPVTSGSPAKQPGLTAGGVSAIITYDDQTGLSIQAEETANSGVYWVDDVPDNEAHSTPMFGWTAKTYQDATGSTNNPVDPATERFHVVTTLGRFSGDNYLAYGYWSKYDPDTLDASGFQSFFYGSMPYPGNIEELPVDLANPVQVTYTGDAAGVFQIVDTTDYGHFDADITLAAHFGEGGAIRASLTNIQGVDSGPSFVDIGTLATTEFSGNRFAGEGPSTLDRWGGLFFGPSASNQVPSGAAGWFEVISYRTTDNSSAFLYGSFGAKCTSNCN